jgi:hypothetical protein
VRLIPINWPHRIDRYPWIVRRVLAVLLLLLPLATAAGCATVRPHERETLGHRAMQDPVWPLLHGLDQHMLEVREASRGAAGAPGGGCGCN